MTKREAELIEQGWQRRFVAAEPRLGEMAALYVETGHEVHLEPLATVEASDTDRAECEGCLICFKGFKDQYQVIYTRPEGWGKGAGKKETVRKRR